MYFLVFILQFIYQIVFYYLAQTKLCPTYKKRTFLDFGLEPFLEAYIKNPRTLLFAKFIFTSILKIADKFIENVGGVGILVIDT